MSGDVERLWARQSRLPGDRWRLVRAVGEAIEATSVLYPGSFVDVGPSFVFPSVTYVEEDARAARVLADEAAVRGIVARREGAPVDAGIRFIRGDDTKNPGLRGAAFDLLVSRYAGFVSEHCTECLSVGGVLLVDPSQRDAAMASIDPRYRLVGVVLARSGRYRVRATGLEEYLIPRSSAAPTPERLHRLGRGIGYTRSAFAHLFARRRQLAEAGQTELTAAPRGPVPIPMTRARR